MSEANESARPNVLIIDDQVELLRALKRVLTKAGMNVSITSDVDVAMQLFKSTKSDLVMSDLVMPRVDGVDLLSRFRAEAPHVSRILMSGHECDPAVMTDAINRGGVFGFLTKPIEPDDLLKVVRAGLAATVKPQANAFGRYQIVRRLAVGGMAEVHLARLAGIASFSKQVVLKTMRPEVASLREFREMFVDEGRLAAMLTHPNVGQVFEMGEQNGRYYIAMEYIEGESLAGFFARSTPQAPLPYEFTVHVMTQLLDALEYVHERKAEDGQPLKLVHRDVSPSNVLLTNDGHVKLVDFGIAKARSNTHHTRTGVVKGKFAYMAPEQMDGKEVDQRSDLFSAGAILYQLLTGKRAMDGGNDLDVMLAIRSGRFPPPREVRPDLPAVFEQLIAKALATDPDKRFQNAREFSRALGEVAMELRLLGDTRAVTETMARLFAGPPPIDPKLTADSKVVEGSYSQAELVSDSQIYSRSMLISDSQVIEVTPSRDESSKPKRILQSGPATLDALPSDLLLGGPALNPDSALIVRRRKKTPYAIAAAAAAMLAIGFGVSQMNAASAEEEPAHVAAAAAEPEKKETAVMMKNVVTQVPVAVASAPKTARKGAPVPAPAVEKVAPMVKGRLKLNASKSTHVWLAGKDLGPAPISVELAPGRKTLTLVGDSGQSQSVDVNIVAGIESELDVSEAP